MVLHSRQDHPVICLLSVSRSTSLKIKFTFHCVYSGGTTGVFQKHNGPTRSWKGVFWTEEYRLLLLPLLWKPFKCLQIVSFKAVIAHTSKARPPQNDFFPNRLFLTFIQRAKRFKFTSACVSLPYILCLFTLTHTHKTYSFTVYTF